MYCFGQHEASAIVTVRCVLGYRAMVDKRCGRNAGAARLNPCWIELQLDRWKPRERFSGSLRWRWV